MSSEMFADELQTSIKQLDGAKSVVVFHGLHFIRKMAVTS